MVGSSGFPRVAAPPQPWARLRNPVGVVTNRAVFILPADLVAYLS